MTQENGPRRHETALETKTFQSCLCDWGLLFIIDEASAIHCLDADTGQKYWTYALKSDRGQLGSALLAADGKVFAGRSILVASKTLKVLCTLDGYSNNICSQPCVANGVVFMVRGKSLWAVCDKGAKSRNHRRQNSRRKCGRFHRRRQPLENGSTMRFLPLMSKRTELNGVTENRTPHISSNVLQMRQLKQTSKGAMRDGGTFGSLLTSGRTRNNDYLQPWHGQR